MTDIIPFLDLAKQHNIPYGTLYTRARKLNLVRYQNPDASDPLQKKAGVEQASVDRITSSTRGHVYINRLSAKTGINFSTLFGRAKKLGVLQFENPAGNRRQKRAFIKRADVPIITQPVRARRTRKTLVAPVISAPQVAPTLTPAGTFELAIRFLTGQATLDEVSNLLGIVAHSPEYIALMRHYLTIHAG